MEQSELERYVEKLEAELDAAQAKFETIYSSVRAVDRVVHNTKKNHKHIYGAARSLYNKFHKTSGTEFGDVTHNLRELPDLAMVLVNKDVNRLNLILDEPLDANTIKKDTISEILLLVTKFADKHDFFLRIITRKNLANPKVYIDFLNENKVHPPENYSFYTDMNTRLAPVVHRLEVTRSDVFVAASPAGKNFIEKLNLPAPKGVNL